MIKIKEFTKKINELGFKVKIDDEDIKVLANPACYGVIAVVSNTCEKVMDVNLFAYRNLDEDIKSKVFDLVTELARTPIEDREEEKKFYLKHRYFKHWDDVQYLTFDYIHKCAYLRCKLSMCQAMQQFTLKEIEEIKKKFNMDFKDFEMIEVE